MDDEALDKVTNGIHKASLLEDDISARFGALVQDRDTLRTEVAQLRQSLEDLQSKHREELSDAQTQLQDTQAEKDEAHEQYQTLLGKVNTIKAQLGERLKSDAVAHPDPPP